MNLNFGVGRFTDYFQGTSSVKDLPTLFELIYTSFTNVMPNEDNYKNSISRIIPHLEAAEASPEFIFGLHKSNALYGGNPMEVSVTADMVRKADYGQMLKLYKNIVNNPGEYTFLFTGNVDVETLRPLLEQYIASLKTRKTKVSKPVAVASTADGVITDNFTIEMNTPAEWLYGFYSGSNVGNSIQQQVKTSLVGDIVSILYTEILREKEGGVYTPMAYSSYDIATNKWNMVYLLKTNEEQAPRMLQLADEIFTNLLKRGATPEQFTRVKGALLSQYENGVRTNSYWHDNIRLYHLLGKDYITEHRSAIENLTLEEFNAFMRTLYDGKNRIQVNMHGVNNHK